MDLFAHYRAIGCEFLALKNRVRNLIGGAHFLTDGEWEESVLRAFISRHVPAHVHVGRGFVVTGDSCSTQIDVLLYDSRYSRGEDQRGWTDPPEDAPQARGERGPHPPRAAKPPKEAGHGRIRVRLSCQPEAGGLVRPCRVHRCRAQAGAGGIADGARPVMVRAVLG